MDGGFWGSRGVEGAGTALEAGAGVAPATVGRGGGLALRCVAAAFIASALVTMATTNGVFVQAFGGAVQAGIVIGLCAGLLAPGAVQGAAAAAGGAVFGWFAQPTTSLSGGPVTLALVAAIAAMVAAGVRAAIERGMVRRAVPLALAVVLVIGALWSTTATLLVATNQRGESLLWYVAQRPQAGLDWTDMDFYRTVVWRMRDGAGYYDAFRQAYNDNGKWGVDPPNVLAVRPPLLFETWAALPDWPRSAVWMFAGLATLAVLSVPVLTGRAGPMGAGIVGAAALAAGALTYSTTDDLFLSEAWCGMLVVLVLAALALAAGRRRRIWVAVAAVLALVAFLTRELMAVLLVAGIVSAFFAPKGQRGFDLAAWGAALAAGLAVWGVHASAASRIVAASASRWSSGSFFGRGGIDFVYQGILGGSMFLGSRAWFPVALVVLGVVGALGLPGVQRKVFAGIAVIGPWLGFLFVGNGAVNLYTGKAVNYWAGIVMPATLALAGIGVAVLLRLPPGACASEGPGGRTFEGGGS